MHTELEKIYPGAAEEFDLACRYSKAALDFLGIELSKFEGFYLNAIKDIQVDKRFRQLEKCFTSAISHYLQKEEEDILQIMEQKNIDIKNPELLISYFSGLIQDQPHSYPAKKLLLQAKIFKELESIDTLNKFPFADIWQFVIDGNKRGQGPYVFENEPGYIVGALKGFLFSLQTRNDEKNPDWYIQIHEICMEEVLTDLGPFHHLLKYIVDCSIEYQEKMFKFPKQALSSRTISVKLMDHLDQVEKREISADYSSRGIRKSHQKIGYAIRNLDQDWYGRNDLEVNNRRWFSYDDGEIALLKKSKKEIHARLTKIFKGYQELLNRAEDDADKLIAHLWLSRELEVHHVFPDGNGRSSILALMSNACSHDSGVLPMFFDDPNMLDANGPEKLCKLSIKAMKNAKTKCEDNECVKIKELENELSEKFSDSHEWDIIHQKAGVNYLRPDTYWPKILILAKEIMDQYKSTNPLVVNLKQEMTHICNSEELEYQEKSERLLECLQNYFINSSGFFCTHSNFKAAITQVITDLYGVTAIPKKTSCFFFTEYEKPVVEIKSKEILFGSSRSSVEYVF